MGQDVHVYIKRISNSSGAIVQLKDELEAIIPPHEIGRRLYDYDENNKKQIHYEATARVKWFDWTQYPPMLLSLKDVEREEPRRRRKTKTWEQSKSTKKKFVAKDLNFLALCKIASYEDIREALDDEANPNAKNRHKTTALMTAAQFNKDKRVIEALLDDGAEIDAKNHNGNTALIFAAMNNSPEVVKVLLDRGADITILNNEKRDALFYAKANKNLNSTDVIKLLTPEPESKPEAKVAPTANPSEALLKACGQGKFDKAMEALNAGADVNASSHNNKSTPLIIASQFGHLDLVNLLLERGADVNAKNGSGNTALHLAILYNSSDVVMALINAGADIDAVNNKNVSALDILPTTKKLKGTDAWKALMKHKLQPSFLKLCRSGSVEEINEAIEAGVNVNASNKISATALIFAAKENTPEVVELLVKAGAELDSQDIYGNTALIYATSYNSEEVVKVLLDSGASTNVINIQGYKALDYAKQNYRLADSDVLTKLSE